jgi:tetratricopeptide (TPR) repeat protein
MEPQGYTEDEKHPGAESRSEIERETGSEQRSHPRDTSATDDALIASRPVANSGWTTDPHQNMIIETSRIRGPGEAIKPSFMLVPVLLRPPHDHAQAAVDGGDAHENDETEGHTDGTSELERSKADRSVHRDRSNDRRNANQKHAASSPSLALTLLFAGVVAFLCGFAGAWGYAHLFGSGKSAEKRESGKTLDSKKTSQMSSSERELRHAEHDWLTAVKELQQSRAAENSARRSEEQAKAVLDFLERTLLSAGRPGDVSVSDAFWAGGQGTDVTLRKALDVADSKVGETLPDRPLVEARVREILGATYVNVGEPAQAVKQFERAMALREAMQGASEPEAASCRNQLAVAYRLAGRTTEAGRLFERSPLSRAHAAVLAVRGATLLHEKKAADAELKLRECLRIREKLQPGDWMTFDTKSLLGEALFEQNKLAEAEPLLVASYEGLKKREGAISAADKQRVTQALARVVKLYDAWGKKDKAAKWREELATLESP